MGESYELVRVTIHYHERGNKLNSRERMRYNIEADTPFLFMVDAPELLNSNVFDDWELVAVDAIWSYDTKAICIEPLPNTGWRGYMGGSVLTDAVATSGAWEAFKDSLPLLVKHGDLLREKASKRIASALPISVVSEINFYAIYSITYTGDEWEGDHDYALIGFLDHSKLKRALQ